MDQEKDKRHEQEELDIDCVSSSHHQKARICLFCQQGVGECQGVKAYSEKRKDILSFTIFVNAFYK